MARTTFRARIDRPRRAPTELRVLILRPVRIELQAPTGSRVRTGRQLLARLGDHLDLGVSRPGRLWVHPDLPRAPLAAPPLDHSARRVQADRRPSDGQVGRGGQGGPAARPGNPRKGRTLQTDGDDRAWA